MLCLLHFPIYIQVRLDEPMFDYLRGTRVLEGHGQLPPSCSHLSRDEHGLLPCTERDAIPQGAVFPLVSFTCVETPEVDVFKCFIC